MGMIEGVLYDMRIAFGISSLAFCRGELTLFYRVSEHGRSYIEITKNNNKKSRILKSNMMISCLPITLHKLEYI